MPMETVRITQWEVERVVQNVTVPYRMLLLLRLSPKGLSDCTCDCGLHLSLSLR